jgi:hypothetical protein
MDLIVMNYSKNYFINKVINTNEVKLKKDVQVQFVEIGNIKNLSGYILLKIDNETIDLSKKYKKANTHFIKVIFAGLRQQTKDIHIDTYKALNSFIKRFCINSIDICFDCFSEVAIHKTNIDRLHWLFRDYFTNSKDTYIEQTSFYINKLVSQLEDADYYKKMILYDKYIKETRYKQLDNSYKNWKRLEITVPINAKLKDIVLDDYCIDVLSMANKCFNIDDFSIDYIEKQKQLLLDKRTHKRYNSFIDEV